MKKSKFLFSSILFSLLFFTITSCSRDSTFDDEMEKEMEQEIMCDTMDIGYESYVSGIIGTYCNGCHSSSSPQGGIITDNYNALNALAENGRLYGVLERLPGFTAMPLGSDKLDQCIIDRVKSWIDDGALDN